MADMAPMEVYAGYTTARSGMRPVETAPSIKGFKRAVASIAMRRRKYPKSANPDPSLSGA